MLGKVLKYSARSVKVTKKYSDWPFLTQDHKMISETCRNFAETELIPIAGILDKEHRFPAEQVKKLGELGMLSVAVSPDYGR